ncbi:hypothetical protein AK812_SmicGene19526 [Symbiodinium microadriaticum]|uniref:Uncharacterized protein n=1 Tax=Symbiodinium microadriaticum TaxID=2951 RepID=A0A1Q9DSD9_SYMMI|nr:hypothetical protein AK812_SmicGene19526 [Symbiodinium microadriaticum]
MAAYMKKTPFAQGDPPVALSAQTAYVHPTNEEPSLARRVGSASVVYMAAGTIIRQLTTALERWRALQHRVILFLDEVHMADRHYALTLSATIQCVVEAAPLTVVLITDNSAKDFMQSVLLEIFSRPELVKDLLEEQRQAASEGMVLSGGTPTPSYDWYPNSDQCTMAMEPLGVRWMYFPSW